MCFSCFLVFFFSGPSQSSSSVLKCGVPKTLAFAFGLRLCSSEDAMGGWKKEGGGKKSSQNGVFGPPSFGAFSTPLRRHCSVCSVQQSTSKQTRSSLEVSRIFWQGVFFGAFSSPYTSDIVFQIQPTSRTHPPSPPTPLPRSQFRVVFFVVFESILI